MGSRTTKIPTNGRPSSAEQQKLFVLRSEQCNADNCYRALFPCSTSSAVAEALRYCATVSAKSATNYPSRAIAACGTKIDRYISACSCPAANCQLGTKSQVTTPRAQSVVMTTTGKKETPAEYPVTIVTPHHAASTDYGAVLTKTPNDSPGGSGSKPSVESANKSLQVESTGTGLLGVENMSLDRAASADSKSANQGDPPADSQLPPSSHSISPQPLPTQLEQSPGTSSSSPPLYPPAGGTTTIPTMPSITFFPTTTSPPGPEDTQILGNKPEGLSVGVVTAIAIGAILAGLLIGAAAYFCRKRRAAHRSARLRTRTLSQEGRPQGFDEKEAAHQVELNESSDSPARVHDTLDSPDTASHIAAETQRAPPPRPPPAELFVMPAELPGTHGIWDRTNSKPWGWDEK